MRILNCMLLLSLVKGSDPTEYDRDLMKLLKASVNTNKKSPLSNHQKPTDPGRDHPTQLDRNLSLLLNTQIAYIKGVVNKIRTPYFKKSSEKALSVQVHIVLFKRVCRPRAF